MSTSEAPHTPNSAPASGFSAKFSHTLRSLEAAQKPGIGVPAYARWVNRRVARYFAAAAVALGITPNGVTAISAACSAAGLVVLITCPPSVGVGICVALLFALGYGLDSADGQVARVTGASSPAGEWLDHVVDSIRVPSVHMATLLSFLLYPAHYSFTGSSAFNGWIIAMPMIFTALTAGHFMSQILAEQLRNNRKDRGAAHRWPPCVPSSTCTWTLAPSAGFTFLLASAPYSLSSTRCFCWLMPQPSCCPCVASTLASRPR